MNEREKQEALDGREKPENPPERVDRRRVLDAEKRRKILAVVANGGSMRAAARYVGCSHSTILRAVAREPEFAEQIGRALQNVEIEALHNIRKAARKKRYWRAAAWLLERTNASDFAQRRPRTFTAPEVAAAAVQFIQLMHEAIPEEHVDHALARLDAIIDYFGREEQMPKPGRLPVPGVVLDYDRDEEPWWMHLDEAFHQVESRHRPAWEGNPGEYHAPVEYEESCDDEEAKDDPSQTDETAHGDDARDAEPPAKP
jgi:hypothetical protein